MKINRVTPWVVILAAGVWIGGCGTANNAAGTAPGASQADPGQTQASAFTAQPVGFRLLASSGVAASPGFSPLAAATDSASLTVSEAVLNLRYIEFKLPEGMNCGKYDDDVKQEEEREKKEDEQKSEGQGEQGSNEDMKSQDTQNKDNKDTGSDTASDMAAAPAVDATPLVDRPATDVEGGRHGRSRKGNCLGEKFRFDGPFHVSLTDGVSNPPLENLAVPPGLYRQIKMKIDDVEKDDKETRLAGRSLVIDGIYSKGATSIPVHFGLKFDEEIEFEAPNGISIGTAGGEDFVIRFPVQDWISGIDLADCELNTPQPGDTLVIDEEGDNECDGIEDMFKQNFKGSGKAEKEDKEKED